MVKEQMHIRWVAETGLVDAIETVVASYKEVRGLQVIALCVSVFHAGICQTTGTTVVM